MKAGQEEMKVELEKVKGELKNLGRKFTHEIRTGREEMTELRGSVEGVRTAMKMGEV